MNETNDTPTLCIRCLVAGRVQGVFFRASTRNEAQRLGLTGYARNLMDGRVEVVACGDKEAVETLREWLRRGPPDARVSGVACEFINYQDFAQFSVA
ncbi:MAG: acylphosphatase [Candidatus Thiodiazotropha sp.]|jgi:acylphosphatase